MNLGNLIDCLEGQPSDRAVMAWLDNNGENALEPDAQYIGDESSYRGYYEQLAFEPTNTPSTCGELLERCRGALDSVYCGYKGGQYRMGRHTPIWFAEWGDCGYKMVFARTETLNSGDVVLRIYVIEDDY